MFPLQFHPAAESQDMTIFLLAHHNANYPDGETIIVLGAYSSDQKAKDAILASGLPGNLVNQNCTSGTAEFWFEITPCELDQPISI
jgi:hypothetical protein